MKKTIIFICLLSLPTMAVKKTKIEECAKTVEKAVKAKAKDEFPNISCDTVEKEKPNQYKCLGAADTKDGSLVWTLKYSIEVKENKNGSCEVLFVFETDRSPPD